MKPLFLLFPTILFFAYSGAAHRDPAADVSYKYKSYKYKKEADAFLSAMPGGMQQRQADAIRNAIAGNTAPLMRVRNSRNTSATLPPDVERMDIDSCLTLFRSKLYDGVSTPLLIYFHGGGWTIGSINSCSRFCAAMAQKGITVLAVNYRLAPENPYPAGLEDCVAAVKTALDNLKEWNCSGISLGGDSSGGNLAIATALSHPKATFNSLILFYPVTKAYPDNSSSWKEFGKGCGLDSDLMEMFNHAYTADIHNPLVSPAEASDSALLELPPTLMISAERDILKDQGTEFMKRIKSLGIQSEHHIVPGTVHLFITVPGQTSAFEYSVARASDFIRSKAER